MGPNPLEYIGVTFSVDGITATLWEKNGGAWVKYDKIGGSANYAFQVERQFRGKGFHLGNWYHVYRWNADDGYNNFSSWVK